MSRIQVGGLRCQPVFSSRIQVGLRARLPMKAGFRLGLGESK